MDKTVNRSLLNFIAASPTAWHAAENLAKRLRCEGYTELLEREEWTVQPGGRYFVRRGGSSVIAFRLPEAAFHGFMIMASHTDSPSFQVKENPEAPVAGLYARLSVEKYGGMLCAPWMDRPLSVAGRVCVRQGERIVTKLVCLDRDLLMIPNLAIHMDRSVNDGKKYDPNVDMLPLLGSSETAGSFRRLVAEAAGVTEGDLISTELLLYPRTPGTVWGAEEEYVSAPRLDDLQCVFGCLEGFLQAEAAESVPVFCAFDNEEVGSGTLQGADSSFLEDTVYRICEAQGLSAGSCRQHLAESFLVSADNAHAVHPNHPEYADRNDRPEMNKGVVIKVNANKRYSTDAVSAAVFAEICRRAQVPVQQFSNRADLAGGSTLGHISLAHVSVETVDIGLAQLAMHSPYETAGARDTAWLIRAARAFYSSSLALDGEGLRILPICGEKP